MTLTDEGVLHESLGALTQLTTLVISMSVSQRYLQKALVLRDFADQDDELLLFHTFYSHWASCSSWKGVRGRGGGGGLLFTAAMKICMREVADI